MKRRVNRTFGVFHQSRYRELTPSLASVVVRQRRRQISPPQVLIAGFLILISTGAVLLFLPVSSAQGNFTSLDQTFFTAVSAATVTGHTVVPTGTYWSPFGQAVIFLLMLLGGLGFIMFATFALLLIGGRSTLQEQIITRGLMIDTVGVEQMAGLRTVGRQVAIFVCLLYGLGAVVIFWQIHGVDGLGIGRSMWDSLFLSVSSYNNAGLNILPEVPAGSSLIRFATNPGLLVTSTVLMVLGGIGWTVIVDLNRNHRFSRLSLDTKLVIVTSLALWGIGFVVVFFAEISNPGTIAGLSGIDRFFVSVFSSVSARTAGLATIDFSQVRDVTLMAYTGLMFIGGGAGSAAGGIKVATFGVIIAAVFSTLRRRRHVEAFRREIGRAQLYRALTLVFLGGLLVVIAMMALTLVDGDIPTLPLLFDLVSAFGTVGASTGLVPELSLTGKSIFIAAMFIGRLGPVILALTVAEGEDDEIYSFPREGVLLG